MIWRLIKDFKSDIVFSASFDYDLDAYYIQKYLFLMHEYVERFITNVPQVHNIASQTMGEVYFETFQSFQLTYIVIVRKTTYHLRGIYSMYFKLIKKKIHNMKDHQMK